MRTLLVGLSLSLALVACVEPNPDYHPGAAVDSPDGSGVSILPGPGVDASETSHDLKMSGPQDMAMGGPKDMGMGGPHDFATPTTPDLSDPGVVGVVCGSELCADPQFCCIGFASRACVSPGLVSCVAAKSIRCDGPEDCGNNKTCCAGFDGTSCLPDCDTNRMLCHSDDDCGGGYCCPHDSGYAHCSNDPC